MKVGIAREEGSGARLYRLRRLCDETRRVKRSLIRQRATVRPPGVVERAAAVAADRVLILEAERHFGTFKFIDRNYLAVDNIYEIGLALVDLLKHRDEYVLLVVNQDLLSDRAAATRTTIVLP